MSDQTEHDMTTCMLCGKASVGDHLICPHCHGTYMKPFVLLVTGTHPTEIDVIYVDTNTLFITIEEGDELPSWIINPSGYDDEGENDTGWRDEGR